MQRLGRAEINGKSSEIFLSSSFSEFLSTLWKMFSNEKPEHYDVLYIDSDNDEIKVTTQEDYTIALNDNKLDFIIKKKKECEELGFIEIAPDNTQVQPRSKKSLESACNYQPSGVGKKEVYGMIDESIYQLESEEDKLRTCFKCNDRKVNKKGKKCSICAGKGYLNKFTWSLKKCIEKSIKKDMTRLIEDEIKKSIAFQMDGLSCLASSSMETTYCSLCKRLIGAEEKMYRCLSCSEFYLCESCEEDHPHQLIRTRGGENYKMEIVNQAELEKKGSQLHKTWTVRNNGKRKWPKGVKLTLIEGEDTKVDVSPIMELNPGKEYKITLTILQPDKNLKQVYQLEANNKRFGDKLVLELKTEAVNNEKDMKKIKAIEKYVEEFWKTTKFDEKYKDSIRAIMEMGNWHPVEILRCLINSKNSIDAAITELISNK